MCLYVMCMIREKNKYKNKRRKNVSELFSFCAQKIFVKCATMRERFCAVYADDEINAKMT